MITGLLSHNSLLTLPASQSYMPSSSTSASSLAALRSPAVAPEVEAMPQSAPGPAPKPPQLPVARVRMPIVCPWERPWGEPARASVAPPLPELCFARRTWRRNYGVLHSRIACFKARIACMIARPRILNLSANRITILLLSRLGCHTSARL